MTEPLTVASLESWLPFSGRVAKYNDYLVEAQLEKENKTLFAKVVDTVTNTKVKHIGQGILARVIACTVFPATTALDIVANLLRAPCEAAMAVFSRNKESQESHKLRAMKCLDDVLKCLRGTVASPLGIVSPDIITRHYVPKQVMTGFVEAGGKYHHAKGKVTYPESIQDVQNLVKHASEHREKIAVIGGGFSQNKGFLSEFPHTTYMNTDKLNSVEIIYGEGGKSYAKVGAGAKWGDIQNLADKQGLSVQVMQASNVFSVGGSLSVNCHGWDHSTGTLSEVVRSVTIVNAQGELEVLKKGDEKLKYILGGHGLCGVIVEAEIELARNEVLYSWGQEVTLSDYPKFFETEILSDPDKHKMHLYRLCLDPDRLLKSAVAVTYSTERHHETNPLKARTTQAVGVSPPLVEEPPKGTLQDRILVHLARLFDIGRRTYWKLERQAMLTEVKATRNEHMRPPIKATFNNSRADAEWLQEYFVPGEHLPYILSELSKTLTENEVTLLNASVRYVKADKNSALPYAQEDRYAIVLFFNQSLAPEEIEKTKTWVKGMIDKVNSVGGTYYLPYEHFADQDQFLASYGKENVDNFYAKKKEYDPQETFYNGIYTDYIEPKDVKEARKAAQELKHQEQLKTCMRHFTEVYGDEKMIQRFNLFLNNVFFQFNPDKLTAIIKDLLKKHGNDYEGFYKELLARAPEAKEGPIGNLKTQLKSLEIIQKTFAEQTEALMGGKNQTIDGYAEIGYTGRLMNAYQKLSGFKFKGPTYAINYGQESAMDLIECGFPRPYKKFIPIDEYAPLTNTIPKESLELITCPIGLHHCPPEQLEVFLQSVADVLKNGGSFILRDHDATPETMPMANLAHSVFNAGTGVEWEDESTETRNFQPVSYWVDLLAKHGLVLEKEPIITDKGDPVKEDSSHNALMRFTKKDLHAEKKRTIEEFDRSMHLSDPLYRREANQTYETGVEWHLVDIAQEQAEFCKTQPAHKFPYMDHIRTINKLSSETIRDGLSHADKKTVDASEHTLMTKFMNVVTTTEFLFKKVVSLPLMFAKDVEKREIHRVVAKTASDYAEFINHTPFYQFSFFSQIGNLWRAVTKDGFSKIFSNAYIALINTIELVAKGIFALPLRASFAGTEPGEIYMLVEDPEDYINKEWLEKSYYAANDKAKENPFKVKVVKEENHHLKMLKVPRYRPFTQIVQDLATHGVVIHKVAGQDNIQLKVKILKDEESDFAKIDSCKLLGNIPIHTEMPADGRKHEYVRLDAKMDKLGDIFKNIKEHHGEVAYIHDF